MGYRLHSFESLSGVLFHVLMASRTHRWTKYPCRRYRVCKQPWKAGDKLMLRIREGMAGIGGESREPGSSSGASGSGVGRAAGRGVGGNAHIDTPQGATLECRHLVLTHIAPLENSTDEHESLCTDRDLGRQVRGCDDGAGRSARRGHRLTPSPAHTTSSRS